MSVLLILLGLFSVYCTFCLLDANSTNALIHDLVATRKLPGDFSLRTVYTGVDALDRILTCIVVFLWPATDLRNTTLNLHATTFLAGTNAVWSLLLLEGYRKGNVRTIVALPVISTLLGQFLTFPVGAAIYYALHLSTSVTVHSPTRQNLTIPRAVLNTLPVMTIIGLIIPVFMFIGPVSDALRQVFIAGWQFWPTYVSMIVFAVHAIFSSPQRNEPAYTDPDTPSQYTYPISLWFVYGVSFLTAAIPHFISITLPIAAMTTPVFREHVAPLCLWDIYTFTLPRIWNIDSNPVATVGEGLHGFLAWNYLATSLAVFIWAGALYRGVNGRLGYGKLAVAAVLVPLVGPIAAAVALLWGREEMVMAKSSSSLDTTATSTSQSKRRSKSGSGMGKWERGGKVLRFD